ncbi:MAG: NYN domain-containing protein [Elusimicrobiota bacterium]
MSVYYIIDGYNLIHCNAEIFSDNIQRARDYLTELIRIKRPHGSPRNNITVVYDGQPGVSSPSAKEIDVRFTSGKEADWMIEKIVKEHLNPKEIIVVTDDKRLRKRIRNYKANWMATEDFISRMKKKLKPPKKSESSLSKKEKKVITDEFLKIWRDK